MGEAPTEPGMPDSASRPTHPPSTARATNGSQDSPAAAVTTTPPEVAALSWSTLTPVVASSTTVPSKPSSATTRLLPPAITRSGSPASSQRRTASTNSLLVVVRSQDRAGPPSRSVVWSERRSGTQDHHGVAQDALAGAGDPEGDGALVSPGALDLDLGAAFGHHDRLGELRAELGDPPGLTDLLVDVARDQGQRKHPMGDHVRKAHAPGDLRVLVDRVRVAAGRGIGDQVGPGDRV